MRPRRLLPLLLPAALLTAAAPSEAARIVSNPCVRYTGNGVRYVPVAGAGFTPAKPQGVTLHWSSGELAGSVDTTPSGGFLDRFLGPERLISSNVGFQRAYTLTAQDGTDPALTASFRLTLIHAGLTAHPNRTRPRGLKTYRFYGFPNGRGVYAHFGFGGRIRRTIYVGRVHGACGKLVHRMRLIPNGTRVRLGEWRIYFSNRRRYTRGSTLVTYPFQIYRTFHF